MKLTTLKLKLFVLLETSWRESKDNQSEIQYLYPIEDSYATFMKNCYKSLRIKTDNPNRKMSVLSRKSYNYC